MSEKVNSVDGSKASEEIRLDTISEVAVKGFKSLAERTAIPIRPLTLLAGANSSGKSSAMQPFLLLKQTLEASFDPGPLLLDGPNSHFTTAGEFLSQAGCSERATYLTIEIRTKRSALTRFGFEWSPGNGVFLDDFVHEIDDPSGEYASFEFDGSYSPSSLSSHLPKSVTAGLGAGTWKMRRDRCFYRAVFYPEGSQTEKLAYPGRFPLEESLGEFLHVPGLRDNPSRRYKTTAVGSRFPGTFDTYVASVIHAWQRDEDAHLHRLTAQLRHLGLTDTVAAERINDTQVEIQVAQNPVGASSEDRLINVADVGLGVSQVLPVLVAMLVAQPGQLVYVEQPEIHLHPRAQARLADAIVEASNRGVRVVVETHSQLLLLAIQTRVAEEAIDPEKVMLHWFTRDADTGITRVDSQQPDEKGAFGDWPEDFSSVERDVENRYLDAAERHLFP